MPAFVGGIKHPNYKHGMSRTKTYGSWNSMRQRCIDKNAINYERYGGRGIKICFRWLKFENFFTDMGIKPDGLSLDRINNDGNYEPGNCRWATLVEQAHNRRVRCDNVTGVPGTRFNKKRKKYEAYYHGLWLGYFNELKNAVIARQTAERVV